MDLAGPLNLRGYFGGSPALTNTELWNGTVGQWFSFSTGGTKGAHLKMQCTLVEHQLYNRDLAVSS